MDSFRLYHDIISDRKLREFTAQECWAWIVLLCLASNSQTRGVILGETEDGLAEECKFSSTKDYRSFIAELQRKRMIEVVRDGIRIVHWQERQQENKRSWVSAPRVRNHLAEFERQMSGLPEHRVGSGNQVKDFNPKLLDFMVQKESLFRINNRHDAARHLVNLERPFEGNRARLELLLDEFKNGAAPTQKTSLDIAWDAAKGYILNRGNTEIPEQVRCAIGRCGGWVQLGSRPDYMLEKQTKQQFLDAYSQLTMEVA